MSFLKINIDDDIYVYDGMSHDFYELENKEEIKQFKNDDFENYKLRQLDISEERIIRELNNEAATLILETTEKCNLRCSYCVFSDDFEGERQHTNIPMNPGVMINAINQFSKRSSEPYIVFYGGEPLTNYLLIKKGVKHANEIFENPHYSMTTNGTLLTSTKFDFLIENNFMITISLDGLKRIHDTYRKFGNGNPSWDVILNNLEKLKEYNPNFYATNIGFNCVIPNDENPEEINEYFNSHDLFKNQEFRFSYTLQSVSSYNVKQNRQRIVDMLNNKNLQQNMYDMDHIGTLIQKVIYRKDEDSRKVCIPFSNRTFVRANGDMQFCERIGGTYGRVNSQEELNDLAVQLNKEYTEFIKDDCSKCWAYRFCEQCPASVTKDGKLDKKIMRKKCGDFKSNMRFSIEMYIRMMRENEDLIDCL